MPPARVASIKLNAECGARFRQQRPGMEFPLAETGRDDLRRGDHRRRTGRLHGGHSRRGVRPEGRAHRERPTELGGTCLHVGCIPTKALLFNAEIWDHLQARGRVRNRRHRHAHARLGRGAQAQERHHHQAHQGPRLPDEEAQDRRHRRLRPTHRPGAGRRAHGRSRRRTAATRAQVKAKNVILATGSEAKMLPGLQADDRILTNIEILSIDQVAQVADRDRRGRGGRGVQLHLPQLRHRGHDRRVPAPRGSGRGRGDIQGNDAPLQEARHRHQHRRQSREDREDRNRRQGDLHRRQRQDRR